MSASTDWIRTARRIVPSLFRLSRATEPTWEFEGVSAIDLGFLRAKGVSALLWDVDGTLMAHHAGQVDPRVRERWDELREAPDLEHAIVSNCELPRFEELGRIFSDIPVLLAFETPNGPAFRVRLNGQETFSGPGAGLLPVAGAVKPARKPNAELVEEGLRRLGHEGTPEAVVLVGDQYFTDVASANLAGIRSIKVPTLDRSSFPLPVRLSQRLERAWIGLRRALGAGRRAPRAP